MSVIQLLEKIGANSEFKKKNIHLDNSEIEELIKTSPDIKCVLVPAEDEDTPADDGEDKEESIDTAVNY